MPPDRPRPEASLDLTPKKSLLGEWSSLAAKSPWPGALFILIVTLAAYGPVFSAGFIWDDDDYVTNNVCLQDAHGLRKIWLDPHATPQYYPLVFTSFWLEYHLWGLAPRGFHVVNVLLQVSVALLLWRALACLKVRGAWLAAAFFALHPVEVESVAWVTERKNLLSALFYLLAALAYLRFAGLAETVLPPRTCWRFYGAACILFVAALLSKTVACSLPAVLLLVLWWRKGRLGWRDVWPVIPFFAVGMALGLTTAWLEKNHVGAVGPDWAFSWVERCLIAGRALCFYAANLVFPVRLAFIYPRWAIDTGVWWQWLFPAAVLAVLALLWLARRKIGRGPLTAVLFFIVTLAPALGFINVYPMRFSFVADHFQYLAGAGLITLAAAGLVRAPQIISGALLLVCASLTWHQCGIYHDLETLWNDTLRKNPACWMARSNLGRLQVQQAFLEKDNQLLSEAETNYLVALQVKPDFDEIHYNYANLLARTGRPAAAEVQYEQTLQLNPAQADAHNNLGALLLKEKRTAEAIAQYRLAIQINPDAMNYHYNLASALAADHQTDEAVAEFQRALKLAPDSELIKRRLRALGVAVN